MGNAEDVSVAQVRVVYQYCLPKSYTLICSHRSILFCFIFFCWCVSVPLPFLSLGNSLPFSDGGDVEDVSVAQVSWGVSALLPKGIYSHLFVSFSYFSVGVSVPLPFLGLGDRLRFRFVITRHARVI